jgi:hypothetical protein
MPPPSSWLKNKPNKKQREAGSRQHGFLSQKVEIIITTAVRS